MANQNNSAISRVASWFGEQDTTLADFSYSGNNNAFGGRFTASETGLISAIRFHHKAPLSDGIAVSVAIYAATGTSDNEVGIKLGNGTGATSGTQSQWISIKLNTPVSVTSGVKYWLVSNRDLGAGSVHGATLASGFRSADWTETNGTWTDNPTNVTYAANEKMVVIAEYAYLIIGSQDASVKANIKTTYYTGATYDWKLSTADDDNKNRGYQS